MWGEHVASLLTRGSLEAGVLRGTCIECPFGFRMEDKKLSSFHWLIRDITSVGYSHGSQKAFVYVNYPSQYLLYLYSEIQI